MTRTNLLRLLLALVLASGGFLGWALTRPDPEVTRPLVRPDGSYRTGSLPGPEQRAVAAAVRAIPVALSYDYRSLDASLGRATELMTPAFSSTFRNTFDRTTREMAVRKKAITSSLVRAAGVVGSVEDGRVTCLIYLDQVLVSSADKKADQPLKVGQSSVHVRLREVGGKWKVDGIDPF